MSCSQTNLTPVTLSSIPAPVPSDVFTPISGQRLYVCDNPEPLTAATFSTPIVTLWDDIVPSSTLVNYRVFMWHHNDTGSTIKYGLTVGNAGSNPITVGAVKYETTVTSNGGDILTNAGLCLAKSLLGQTLTSGSTVTVSSGAVQTVLEFTLAAGQVRGMVVEFTLSSASNMSAKVRTLAGNSSTAALNTHQGAVIGSVLTHPRGTWNYADVQGAGATISLGSGGVSNSISVLGSPLYGSPSVFPGTLPNSASFGGVYKFNLTINNTSGTAQTANLYLNPRGGLFAGAVKVGSNPVYGIAKTTTDQGVKIGAFSLASGASVVVPIQLTTAGGSSTPVAFFVRNA